HDGMTEPPETLRLRSHQRRCNVVATVLGRSNIVTSTLAKKVSIAINTWLDLVDRLRQRFTSRRAARRLEAGHACWTVEERQRVIAFLGRCNGRGRLRPGIVSRFRPNGRRDVGR